MRPWQFSRPKGPGFEIRRDFYLSVLSSKAVLPAIAEVLNPKGEHGAVEGFGVPLADSKDPALLRQPMQRGAYALATKDRKTLLRMLVLSKEEAGFDPAVFARSSMAIGAEPELLARVQGTWTLLQITFESYDPEVYPALSFLLQVAERLGTLCEGVVADPIAARYRLPERLRHYPSIDPKVDARDHVNVRARSENSGLRVYTTGLRKFTLSEYEVANVPEAAQADAETLLIRLAQTALMGKAPREGSRIGDIEVRVGGLDRGLWEGINVMELLLPLGREAEALRAANG